jgi:hypothetical protein
MPAIPAAVGGVDTFHIAVVSEFLTTEHPDMRRRFWKSDRRLGRL